MKPALNPAGNIEGLQVLRAVAALMVVVYHARLSVPGSSGWPPFGASGVDIFFVISGFVMAYTTAKLSTPAPFDERLAAAGRFIRKRAIRVVPLYWLALIWTSRREVARGIVGKDLVKDFFFIPHPNAVYHGWLAPTLQQGWTLNYEAFFYVLFAAAMLLGTAKIRGLLCCLAALAVAGYWLSLIGWPVNDDSAAGIVRRFYGDNIILEFGYGVMIERAVYGRFASGWPRWVSWLGLALGFILIALGHDVWPRALTEGVPAALIVWTGIQAFAGTRSPVLELLGAASYSIYLFHWASFGPVKPLAAALAGMSEGSLKVALLMCAHIAMALFAGLALHLLIEKPFMRWASRRFADKPTKLPAVSSA